jgi:hypothetical protein
MIVDAEKGKQSSITSISLASTDRRAVRENKGINHSHLLATRQMNAVDSERCREVGLGRDVGVKLQAECPQITH